jgi:ubiquinone biosynthesis protein UbiJ
MTIMPADLPLSSTGITEDVQDAVADAFPLFESVQKLARLGVSVSFTVAPKRIVATITVTAGAVQVLPALLEEIDDARPGQLPDGKLVVTGSMCQGTVTLRVLIPQEWVSAEELAVLTGTVAADPSNLL